MWWIGRYGHCARIQTTEERADVFESGRKQQQHALALRALGLQPRTDCARLTIELRVSQRTLFDLAVSKKSVGESFRLASGSPAQELTPIAIQRTAHRPLFRQSSAIHRLRRFIHRVCVICG